MTILGVISDTHGLLRPEALDALLGVNRILHAGDVGTPEILEQLQTVAPVTAVRGNVDGGDLASRLPLNEVIEIDGISIYMLHILEMLDLKPQAAGFAAVIYGHSHVPKIEEKNGVLYFNPGSAGPRRFKLPITVGKLMVDGKKLHAEIIDLTSSDRRLPSNR
jgi:hypothetical protein